MSDIMTLLVPTGVVSAECRESVAPSLLYPEESFFIAGVTPKRASEFASGRICARATLKRIGIERFPLLGDETGAPRWPNGVVGSITHTAGFCAAAIGTADQFVGIGIDAEPCGRISENVSRLILTDREARFLNDLPSHERAPLATVFFSVKESIYKCAHPNERVPIRFKDIDVVFDDVESRLPVKSFTGIIFDRMKILGHFIIEEAHVISAATLCRQV